VIVYCPFWYVKQYSVNTSKSRQLSTNDQCSGLTVSCKQSQTPCLPVRRWKPEDKMTYILFSQDCGKSWKVIGLSIWTAIINLRTDAKSNHRIQINCRPEPDETFTFVKGIYKLILMRFALNGKRSSKICVHNCSSTIDFFCLYRIDIHWLFADTIPIFPGTLFS
jgi:hypothetical protein